MYEQSWPFFNLKFLTQCWPDFTFDLYECKPEPIIVIRRKCFVNWRNLLFSWEQIHLADVTFFAELVCITSLWKTLSIIWDIVCNPSLQHLIVDFVTSKRNVFIWHGLASIRVDFNLCWFEQIEYRLEGVFLAYRLNRYSWVYGF